MFVSLSTSTEEDAPFEFKDTPQPLCLTGLRAADGSVCASELRFPLSNCPNFNSLAATVAANHPEFNDGV